MLFIENHLNPVKIIYAMAKRQDTYSVPGLSKQERQLFVVFHQLPVHLKILKVRVRTKKM